MTSVAVPTSAPARGSQRFRPLRVKAVVRESADAISVVIEVPPELASTYIYEAGQYVTLRLPVDGVDYHRSYSMSSAPGVDSDLAFTVKRVPGGIVSNYLNDRLAVDDLLAISPPTGTFVLGADDRDVTAFAAGSGITPIFSIIKHTLHAHTRPVRLLYANRDRGSAIFRSQLDGLVERHPERLAVEYHEDVVNGFVDQTRVAGFSSGATSTTYLVCGPAEFMDVVVSGLSRRGTRPEQVRIERFSPPDTEPADLPAPGTTDAPCVEVTIELGGRKVTVPYRPRTTVLQTARSAGFSAPSSCETGTCATCMARVLEGQVVMRNNEALTQEEVAEGWVLTCQSLPTSETLSVIYE